MESKIKELKNQILFINFNSDFNCFCVGTENGYIICNVEKYQRIMDRSKKQNNNLKFYRNEWWYRKNRNVKKNKYFSTSWGRKKS